MSAMRPTKPERAARRRRPLLPRRDDQGISIIEVLVTVTIIALVMFPAGRLFFLTQASASDNSARQDAAALASSVISNLESTAYSTVGFTQAHIDSAEAAASGYYTAGYDTSTYIAGTSSPCSSACGSYYFGGTAPDQQMATVSTGSTDVSGSFNLGANAKSFGAYVTGVISGTWVFSVETRVLWASTSVQSCPGQSPSTATETQAEKQVLVTVSWRSPTTGHVSMSESSIVYPGGAAPYTGPSYVAANAPSAPVVSAPIVATVTGQVDISWVVPAIGEGTCYAVSWVDPSSDVTTSGLLSSSDQYSTAGSGSGYVVPPPRAGTTGTAEYAVGGLSSADPYSFFVTAYSADGIESTVSLDTASAIPSGGPLITAISPAFGPNGVATAVTLTGSGFTATTSFTFGANPATIVGTCALTSCKVQSPTNGTNIVNVYGTDSALGVQSPPTAENQFSFEPAVTGLSPLGGSPGGGTTITITGTNFVPAATKIYFGTTLATLITCTTTTTCSGATPAGTALSVVDVTAVTAGGTSLTNFNDKYAYSS